MEGLTVEMTAADRRRAVLVEATRLFNEGEDWLTFFRLLLGVNGVAREKFPDQEEFREFEQSDEFAQIETMLFSLRAEKRNPKPNGEPTRVITVRLPASVHEALRAEASDHRTSINKLCITKLLQSLHEETIPVPRGSERPAARTAHGSEFPSPTVAPRRAVTQSESPPTVGYEAIEPDSIDQAPGTNSALNARPIPQTGDPIESKRPQADL